MFSNIFQSETCPGLIPLILSYIQTLDLDIKTQWVISEYVRFIEKRAAGEIPTNASWLRQQVLSHPEYK